MTCDELIKKADKKRNREFFEDDYGVLTMRLMIKRVTIDFDAKNMYPTSMPIMMKPFVNLTLGEEWDVEFKD